MTKEKLREINEYIKRRKEERKSEATKIRNLFTKHKEFIKTKYKTTEFNEPVMFFERRSGEVEFHENVTAGIFEYTHSDGNKRFIVINTKYIKKFGFADKRFKGYYCHEDHPLPLPEDPIMTVEQMNILVEKSLNDHKKWQTQEIKANTERWKVIGMIIIGIILAIMFYKLVIPQKTPETIHTIVQTINTTPTILK